MASDELPVGQWLELWTTAEPEAVDSVADVFLRWGHGVSIEPQLAAGDEDEGGEPDSTAPVVVKTYLSMDDQTEARRQELEQAIWHLGRLRQIDALQTRVRAESEWADAWKRHFLVQHVSDSLVIVPSWRRYGARPRELVLRLDPGMAFGTGLHPTTRLCLRALEEWLQPGCRVLDVGTGSGILAIAAARLGAESVLGLEVDQVAVRVAAENVHANRVHGQVHVEEGSLPINPVPLPFDLVVANISLRTNLELLPNVPRLLRPGGVAIFSGMLFDAVQEFQGAMRQRGIEPGEVSREGDWVAVVGSSAREISGGSSSF